MWKFKLGLIVAGCILAFVGVKEMKLAEGSQPTPTAVDLATLEDGAEISNTNMELNDFYSVYYGAVYEYKKSKYSDAEPDADTRLSKTYYPGDRHQPSLHCRAGGAGCGIP